MQRRHNDILRMITDEFVIKLNSRRIMMPSDGTDDMSALLKTAQCKDVATVQHFHDDTAAVIAAQAQSLAAKHVTALALSCHQENDVYTKNFISVATVTS